MIEGNTKVMASHLKKDAYLYVRQSTMRQVFENTESTKRQYALRQKAVALGWPLERVHVIDCDLGQSGASAADREGFQKLVTEVSVGRAGIVLGLEVSRLARNNTDWHRLLEICALSDTLILDEDGLYDPKHFNDRLLLGLKGTMSEAELHILGARLRGGILNKVRRGEFASPIPIGFVYDDHHRIQLDPDKQVRETITAFFQAFRRLASARSTLKYFHKQGLLFPRRLRTGPSKGRLVWSELEYSRALRLLHNPRYAGAFFYGRTRTMKQVDGGKSSKAVPPDEWYTLIPNAHEGYITWEEYKDNEHRLREQAQAYGQERRKGPPRGGPALLQGIVICGVCGKRMTVRYHARKSGIFPAYLCQKDFIEHGGQICQRLPGGTIDKAVGELLLNTLTPMTLEVALSVQQEISSRLEEADRLRAKQVERAKYEVELARQRFMQVDPNNRLVADVLEAEWNEKLRASKDVQEEYERQRQADRILVDQEMRRRVMHLASDVPKLWKDPGTSDLDRKRIVRLLLEDVTLITQNQIMVHVRFKGGMATTITLPSPKRVWENWKTPTEMVAQIDCLLNDYTDSQIAKILNERGQLSGKGKAFNSGMIGHIRRRYDLKSRYDRLRVNGMLTAEEMAGRLGLRPRTIKLQYRYGLLKGHAYNDKNECLFDPPSPESHKKDLVQKIVKCGQFSQDSTNRRKEVQYEA